MTDAQRIAAEIDAQRGELESSGTPATLILIGRAAHDALLRHVWPTRGGEARLSQFRCLPVFVRGAGLSVSAVHRVKK